MARIRSIHPEQWTDDQFVTSSPLARLIAIGVRNEADDNGVFEWNPVKLKMRLLPADNCDMVELMQELVETGQVWRYEVNGKPFGMIRNFTKYQKPKKPTFYHPIPTEPLPKGFGIHPSYKGQQSGTSSPPVPNQSGNSSSDGEKGERESREKKKTRARFVPPTLEQITAYCGERKNTVNPQAFLSHYESNGWKVGKNPMQDWKAAVRTWEQRSEGNVRPIEASGPRSRPLVG